MKRLMLFLTMVLSFACNMYARIRRVDDAIEQAKVFIRMYYKEYGMLPDSLEELEEQAHRKMDIGNYFKNEKEIGFSYKLIKFTENLLWLSVESEKVEKESQFFLYIVMADKHQIIVFSEINPLYKYSIMPSGREVDYYAYDNKYERMNDYEDIYVPWAEKILQESYEVIKPPRFLCE